MAAALRSMQQAPTLLSKCGKLTRPALVTISVRGMKVKEFKTENPQNLFNPWPYETKDYRWYHSIFNLDRTINRMDENSKVIVIEGNVGAGKSTLAKGLAEALGMKHYPEADYEDYYNVMYPVDLRDIEDRLGPTAKPFRIRDFYNDPNHPLVAQFQVMKYIARYFQNCEALLHLFSTGQGVILERTPHSDFVFVDAMMKEGYMGRLARRYYYELKSNTIQDLMRPHCIIYLDAPVDVCLDRIKKRNIDYEVNSKVLTPEYLKLLETGYKENYLPQMEPFCATLVYDWTTFADAEAVAEDLEKVEFDKHRYYYDSMFRDWGLLIEKSDWDQPRVKYTKWKDWAVEHVFVPETLGAGELWVTADDAFEMRKAFDDEMEKRSPYYAGPDASPWKRFTKLFGIA